MLSGTPATTRAGHGAATRGRGLTSRRRLRLRRWPRALLGADLAERCAGLGAGRQRSGDGAAGTQAARRREHERGRAGEWCCATLGAHAAWPVASRRRRGGHPQCLGRSRRGDVTRGRWGDGAGGPGRSSSGENNDSVDIVGTEHRQSRCRLAWMYNVAARGRVGTRWSTGAQFAFSRALASICGLRAWGSFCSPRAGGAWRLAWNWHAAGTREPRARGRWRGGGRQKRAGLLLQAGSILGPRRAPTPKVQDCSRMGWKASGGGRGCAAGFGVRCTRSTSQGAVGFGVSGWAHAHGAGSRKGGEGAGVAPVAGGATRGR